MSKQHLDHSTKESTTALLSSDQPADSSNLPISTTKQDQPSSSSTPRQVIAVSASKKPAAFFNLAKKFLVTDEECDLSALEGAILAAVDAALLLERSKYAKIIRVQTSYVIVEPKPKTSQEDTIKLNEIEHPSEEQLHAIVVDSAQHSSNHHPTALQPRSTEPNSQQDQQQQQHLTTNLPTNDSSITSTSLNKPKRSNQARAKGEPLRRARIIITIKRTEEYTQWLRENPFHVDADDSST